MMRRWFTILALAGYAGFFTGVVRVAHEASVTTTCCAPESGESKPHKEPHHDSSKCPLCYIISTAGSALIHEGVALAPHDTVWHLRHAVEYRADVPTGGTDAIIPRAPPVSHV
jgi:hypothetical protein